MPYEYDTLDPITQKLVSVQDTISPLSAAVDALDARVMRGELTQKEAAPARKTLLATIKGYEDAYLAEVAGGEDDADDVEGTE